MYRLGQSLPRPYAGYTYPPKKRRFTLTVRQTQSLEQSVSHGVTVTDSIGLNKILLLSVVDTVTVTDEIVSGKVYTYIVSDSVTASDNIGLTIRHPIIYIVSVSHDVTVQEIIRPNVIKHLALIDSVVVSEDFKQLANIIHNVVVTQDIVLTTIRYRSVSHSISVIDDIFINSPRPLSVVHNIFVTDAVEGRNTTFHETVTDTVTASDFVSGRNSTFHLNIVHNVSASQIIRVIGAVYNQSVAHSVAVTQRVNLQYKFEITHDVNVFQTYSKKRFITRSIDTALTETSTFARDLTFTLTTTLEETSIWTRQIDVTRGLDTPLIETSILNSVLFIQNPGPHPVASGVNFVYGFLTLLESKFGTIVLSVPELNDSIKHNDQIEIKRSMSGVLKAYIKKGTTTILNYTWLLDYPKALELRQWALTNISETITLTNWKGEIWRGKIVNDDLTLKAESKLQGNPRQQTSVSIQFEGIKVNG